MLKPRDIFMALCTTVLFGIQVGGTSPVAAQDVIQTAPAFVVNQYRANAANGDVGAQFRLGLLQERGLVSGTPNLEEAARLYRLAAENGHPSAQFKLGSFLESGIAGEQDIEAAAALYHRAAEQGVAEAQFNLAVLLQEGRGVAQDIPAAVRWFEQAAFRGVTSAMRTLGLLYLAEVETAPRDAIEAWAWLTLALEAGDALAAGYLKDVEAQLSAESQSEAMRLADAYRQLRLKP